MEAEMECVVLEVIKDLIDAVECQMVDGSREIMSEARNYYFDECAAFVELVPVCFDLGTVEVRLSCLTMSKNYCAIGSQCGALFLFNRKICQSVRPLRTSYDEIITRLEAFSGDNGKEYLAVGHKSGTLIILFLPTSHAQGTRKLQQSILDEVHAGSAILCLDWASDGSKLFSADAKGHVVMTHVDFQNNEFISTTVCVEREIFHLRSAGDYLAIATDYCYKVVNVSNNCVLITKRHLKDTFSRISGVTFYKSSNLLLILLHSGEILAHYIADSSVLSKFKDLKKMVDDGIYGDKSRVCSTNLSRKALGSKFFDVGDFLSARVKSFTSGRTLVYYTKDRFLICNLRCKSHNENSVAVVEVFDFNELFDDKQNLEIFDIVCHGDDDFMELFVLASNQQVYRLSKLPAPPALLQFDPTARNLYNSPPFVGVLLNSLSNVAQKSGKSLFERFQTTGGTSSNSTSGGVSRFVDNFLLGGSVVSTHRSDVANDLSTSSSSNNDSFSSAKSLEDQLKQSPKNLVRSSKKIVSESVEQDAGSDSGFKFFRNAKSFRLSDSSKLSSNLQNIFDHLKNTNLLSDYDSQSLRHEKMRDDLLSEVSSSIITGELEGSIIEDNFDDDGEDVVECQGKVVNVSRRKKTIRLKRNLSRIHKDFYKNPSLIKPGEFRTSPPLLSTNSPTLACSDNPTPCNNDITDANLEKILRVIGLHDPTSAMESTEDCYSQEDNDSSEEALIAKPAASLDEASDNFSAKECTAQVSNPLDCSNVISDVSESSGNTEREKDYKTVGTAEENAEVVDVSLLIGGETEFVDQHISLEDSITNKSNCKSIALSIEEEHTRLSENDSLKNLLNKNEKPTCQTDEASVSCEVHSNEEVLRMTDFDAKTSFNLSNEMNLNYFASNVAEAKYSFESSTASTSSSCLPNFNADYPLIDMRLTENWVSGEWLALPLLPFGPLGAFDASSQYLFACPPTTSGGLFKRFVGWSSSAVYRPHVLKLHCRRKRPNGSNDCQLFWEPLDWSGITSTSAIAINDAGSIVWRIINDTVYMAKGDIETIVSNSSDKSAIKWEVQTSGAEGAVTQIELAGRTAWYLSKKGVFVQMELPELGIFYRAECPFTLKELTASENAVWTLNAANGNLVIRSGLLHCPMGVDWVEDSQGNGLRFISISLFSRFGFGLDLKGQLWMNANVTTNTPFGTGAWYKIESLDFAVKSLLADSSKRGLVGPRDKWRVRATSTALFVALGGSSLILMALTPVFAHLTTNPVPHRLAIYNCFDMISAGGYCGESNENIYAVDKSSRREVFAYSTSENNFTSLPPISRAICNSFAKRLNRPVTNEFANTSTLCIEAMQRKIAAISACREQVFVVDDAGDCFMYTTIDTSILYRTFNLSSKLLDPIVTTNSARDWICFPRPKVNGKEAHLVAVAASSSSLWIIDTNGQIFWMSNMLFDRSSSDASTIWTQILPPSNTTSKFNEIKISPRMGQDVWIFDSLSGEYWRRQGITFDKPLGESWVRINASLKIEDLAVSETSVWALASSNSSETRILYKLVESSTELPASKRWMPVMSTKLTFVLLRISIDAVESRIWGLDDNGAILRHEMKMYPSESTSQLSFESLQSLSEDAS